MQNALIEENYFDVDDDALCVKSGRDWDGRQFGRPARDILFRNNVRDSDGINRGKTACESGKHQLLQVIGRGHGITIGSETSGSVYNGNSRPAFRPAVRGRAMPGAISLLDLPLRNRSPRLCQLLLVTVRELLRSCYVHVRAVTFDNITMANTGTGIRMKTERGRGGVVSDIVYRNMCARAGFSVDRKLRRLGFGSFCATECGGGAGGAAI